MDTPQEGYVLVVEDIPDILVLLEATLKFKGYRVVTATNGEDALNIIMKERPTLIVADILMPKIDGFNLVHRLRLNPETRAIPVIFLSATYVTPEDKEFAMSIGVNRFMEKPVDMNAFLPVVEKLMKQGGITTPHPLNDAEFFKGYQKRLELKLAQKNSQIARDERLLETLPEADKPNIKQSLERGVAEREEIQHLLTEVRERMEKP